MGWILFLSGAIASTAALHIHGHYRRAPWQVYLFKPATTLTIILAAITLSFWDTRSYRLLILARLVFSLMGDVFLMLPKDRFIAGLGSFLIAHIFYIAAFADGWQDMHWYFLVIGLGVGVAYLKAIWQHLGRLKLAVSIYTMTLSALLWFALERWFVVNDVAATIGLVGVVLFAVSDGLLGWNRFAKSFYWAEASLLVCYYSAQFCIVLSTASF